MMPKPIVKEIPVLKWFNGASAQHRGKRSQPSANIVVRESPEHWGGPLVLCGACGTGVSREDCFCKKCGVKLNHP